MTDAIPFDEPVFAEQADAVVSPCGLYRYCLARRWATEGKTLCFVMLNPSTADSVAAVDDATTRKCKRFARIKGFTAIEVVNLYAYRATDPADLKYMGYPVGPLDDAYLLSTARRVDKAGGTVCVAWGAAAPMDRARQVLADLAELGIEPVSLAVTKRGHPAHPLYLSSTSGFNNFAYGREAVAA